MALLITFPSRCPDRLWPASGKQSEPLVSRFLRMV